jgi:putative nucleotidyltransferase with HDIG domain
VNVAHPAIATWAAGQAYVVGWYIVPQLTSLSEALVWLPPIALTVTYFVAHSVMGAVITGLESDTPPMVVWRRQAPFLAVRHYTAASFAIVAGASGQAFNPIVFGMLVPLLTLSYIAYREASGRVDAANRHVEEVERLYRATVETLALAVDAKDQVTHGHIRRVQRHAMAVARALGVTNSTELKALESAALLHDVGKLAMPDYVLNKPGSLTQREFETIKQHAAKGATILNAVDFPYPVVPTVRHHHEWWNGRGYPDGLAGEAIPLSARILAVVDCFDALTSDRPYRRRLSDDTAIEMLRERSGTVYDPQIVEGFIKLVPELRREDASSDRAPAAEEPFVDRMLLDDEAVDASALATSQDEATVRAREAGRETMDKIVKLFPGAEACLFAVSQGGEIVVPAIATSRLEHSMSGGPLLIGQGLSGWVAANRHSIINSDAGLDLGEQVSALGLRGAAATPVFAFGTLVAVLTIYVPERGAFSNHQARVIGILAQEIGNALVDREKVTAR